MVRAFGNKYMNSCPPAEDGADDSVQEFGSEPLAQAWVEDGGKKYPR